MQIEIPGLTAPSSASTPAPAADEVPVPFVHGPSGSVNRSPAARESAGYGWMSTSRPVSSRKR